MATLESQLMSISEMDQLISIYSKSEATDDYGGQVITTGTLISNVRAKVRYERTNEGEDEKRKTFTQDIKVWMRYYSLLNKTHTVYWNSTEWEIYAIETTPRNRFHVLKCREIER